MSRLFPIELLGKGTGDVESFTSYIFRSAYSHGVSVGELLRFVYDSIPYQKGGVAPSLSKYPLLHSLVRPNRLTNHLLDSFEVMTHQELKSSIFWMFDYLFSRSSGEVFNGFRWCPQCLQETEERGEEVHFKLIWSLSALTVCPEHRILLIDECSFCGHKQNSFVRRQKLGLCQRCDNSLALIPPDLDEKAISESWEFVGQDLVDLIDELSRTPISSITNMPKFRKESIYIVDDFRRTTQYIYRYLADFTGPCDETIDLKSVRRVAFRLGVPIMTLIRGEVGCISKALDGDWNNESHRVIAINRRIKRNHQRILNQAKRIVYLSNTPPSLKELARKLDVSVGYFEYRHPALVKIVVHRYQEYELYRTLQKRYLAQRHALAFFKDEKLKGEVLSRKKAYRILREATGLPKFLLKDAIRTAFNALS